MATGTDGADADLDFAKMPLELCYRFAPEVKGATLAFLMEKS